MLPNQIGSVQLVQAVERGGAWLSCGMAIVTAVPMLCFRCCVLLHNTVACDRGCIDAIASRSATRPVPPVRALQQACSSLCPVLAGEGAPRSTGSGHCHAPA